MINYNEFANFFRCWGALPSTPTGYPSSVVSKVIAEAKREHGQNFSTFVYQTVEIWNVDGIRNWVDFYQSYASSASPKQYTAPAIDRARKTVSFRGPKIS